jgi:hypothetical protein
MPYRTCDHLKEDGVFCQSPALRGATTATSTSIFADALAEMPLNSFALTILPTMSLFTAACKQVIRILLIPRNLGGRGEGGGGGRPGQLRNSPIFQPVDACYGGSAFTYDSRGGPCDG